ncbi:MAG: hypothetical protein ACE366_27265 [Bradymonadia bacterium]
MKKHTSLSLSCARVALPLVGLTLPLMASAEVSRPVLLAQQPSAHCQAPRWAPDGSEVAYDVYNPKGDSRQTFITTLTPDGRPKNQRREVKIAGKSSWGAKGPPVVDFEWAPDKKLLSDPFVFSSRGPKKNYDLYADGTWLTEHNGNDGQPAWSLDGRFIAFTSQERDSGVVKVLDLSGDASPRQLTFWNDSTEYMPRWAPTGHTLAFVRSQSGRQGQDIGVIDDVVKPRETARMLTNWEGDEMRPSWSPDGQLIAFYANKGRKQKDDKIFDLWVVDRNGGGAKQLAKDVVVDDHRGPAWSNDSSSVFYVKRDFKVDNPIMWTRVDGSARGVIKTNTQINSDLAVFPVEGGARMRLAFKALGEKGSPNKTWQRLYMVTFSMADLVGE